MLEQDEIKKVLEIDKQYKYKELCELLNESWTEACNKKPQQLEDWERYFDYKRIDNRNYLIKKIYDKPFPGIENFTNTFENERMVLMAQAKSNKKCRNK